MPGTLIFSDHSPDGLILLFGKDVRKGVRLKNASLLDVAPTALALLGLPRADDMDGGALMDAFVPSSPATRPSTTIATYGGSGSAWMRLIASILF
jgi:arylsulfatase A-like enzyme